MTHRRLLGLLLAAVLTLVLPGAPAGAEAGTATAPTQSRAVDPKGDYPHLPEECVGKDLIPLHPMKCNLTSFDRSRPTIVLWGDSHAWQVVPALLAQVEGRDVNVVAFLLGSCPAMHNNLTPAERRTAPDCLKSNAKAFDYVKLLKSQKRDVRVVLGTYWQRYLQAIEHRRFGSYHGQMAAHFETGGPRLFRRLGRLRIGVDVVGQAVTVPSRARNCPLGNDPYACDLRRHRAIREETGTRRWVKGQMEALVEPAYVDINRMCSSTTCYARGPGGIYTFFDVYHITASMSRLVSFVFQGTVDRAGGT
jgi:hypothetical protein